MSSSSTTVISAERHERLRQFLRDLLEYHELFWTLVHREIQVHYKQTVLGVAWVVLQPLLTTGAFMVIFGKIARMPTDGLPLVLFYFPALVAWNTFASAVSRAANCLAVNAQLVTKVYFPRVALPGAVVLGSLLDFSVGWALLNVLTLSMGYWNWQLVVMTPFLMVIQATTAMGFGLVLAMVNARYRDVRNAVGFIVQLMMLGTPVIYPFSRLPEWVQQLLFLNPMAAVVTTYRQCMQGDPIRDWVFLYCSFAMALVYLCAGVWFFRRMESRLADIL